MNLETFVREIVSGAVDNYLNTGVASTPVAAPAPQDSGLLDDTQTGSTAAPKNCPVHATDGAFTVPAESSARHVHLSLEDVETLFGKGYSLTQKRPLSQPGQYLAEERVTLIGPKGTFKNVAVLGPPRGHTQVEVSASDARALGLNPPVALSGELACAADMLIASKDAFLMAEQSLIIARNHLHMAPEEAAAAGLQNGDLVDIRLCTDRPVTFNDVVVRSGDGHKLALHIDFDEANACGWKDGCKAVILGTSSFSDKANDSPSESPLPNGGSDTLGQGDVVISTGFLTEVQVRDALAAGATAVVVPERAVVSPLAKDMLQKHGITLKKL